MPDKQLSDKAIDIKGKKYVLVADRILYFNETYKEGSITTELVSEPDASLVIIKATIYPDGIGSDIVKIDSESTIIPIGERRFTGYSQAKWGDGYINKTSALENCETSAVGRALAMMGIGVIDSIASVDEIKKTENPAYAKPVVTVKQKLELQKSMIEKGIDNDHQQEYVEQVIGKPRVESSEEYETLRKAVEKL